MTVNCQRKVFEISMLFQRFRNHLVFICCISIQSRPSMMRGHRQFLLSVDAHGKAAVIPPRWSLIVVWFQPDLDRAWVVDLYHGIFSMASIPHLDKKVSTILACQALFYFSQRTTLLPLMVTPPTSYEECGMKSRRHRAPSPGQKATRKLSRAMGFVKVLVG